MRDTLSIKMTLLETEKKEILKAYKENGINMAGRILKMIKDDVKKLEDFNK